MAIELPAIRQRIEVDGSGLDKMQGKLGKIGKGLGLAVAAGAATAAVAVGAFVAGGIKGAVDLERGLREIVTLFGTTGSEADILMGELTAGVAELSNEVGIAASEITGGLYSAISAGVPKDNAFEFMKVASQAAIAGVTDVETSVDGLTTVINAFGLEADDAGAVADSMFAAVQGGKTTFEELSASMFQVAPAAAGLGIGFEDVNAAIATLTASGTPTSVATTQMRAALSELGKGGTKAATAFEEISGQTFPDFIAAGGTLEEGLAMMGEAAGGSATAMSNMFGSVEAGASASQLGITNAAKFTEELERQQGAFGATTDAFGTMQEGVGRKMEMVKTKISNAAIAIGTAALPLISDAMDALEPYIESFTDAITWLTEGGLGGLRDTVQEIFGGDSGMVGPISGAFATVKGVFETAVAFVTENMDQIKEIIGGVIEVVTILWDMFGEDIMAFVTSTFDAIMVVIGGAMDFVQGLIETVLGILTGDWDRAWEGIKQMVGGVWEMIKGIVSMGIERIKLLFKIGLGLIAGIFGGMWRNIVDGISGAWTAIKNGVGKIIDSVKEKGTEALDWFRELPGRLLAALGKVNTMLKDAGKGIVQGLIDGITEKFAALRDKAGEIAGAVRDFLPFSPAKTGPLSGSGSPDKAGRKIGDMLAHGIERSRSDVMQAAAGLASAASGSLPTSARFSASADANLDGTQRQGRDLSDRRTVITVNSNDPLATARALDREMAWQSLGAS
jgi:TP901 family phage tail tape measure protein